MRRRRLLATVGTALGSVAGCVTRGEGQPLTVAGPGEDGRLPARHTCDGGGASPPFSVESAPDPTEAFAVVAESNRDAIVEPVLWTLWNVPADRAAIPAGLRRRRTLDGLGGARQGIAPDGSPGYAPPCPAAGTTENYRFQVYALETTLDLPTDIENDDALEAITGATLASERFVLSYERPADAE